MSQNLPKRSLWDFLSLCHPNHFILAGTNNRNLIMTYTTNSSWPLLKQIKIFSSILTVYFNCTYFPYYMCELLECLLRISPSGQNPCRGNKCKLFREHCSLWGGGGEWCCWYFTNMAFLLSLEICYPFINQALRVTSPVSKFSLQLWVQISATPRAEL